MSRVRSPLGDIRSASHGCSRKICVFSLGVTAGEQSPRLARRAAKGRFLDSPRGQRRGVIGYATLKALRFPVSVSAEWRPPAATPLLRNRSVATVAQF